MDINQSILETEVMLGRAMTPDIKIETRLGRSVGLVLADRNQFETALLNLALNARDAMPNGGRLTIGTADITLDAAYAALHPGMPPGRYVLIAVSDTGTGMALNIAERAFEPLFTTKNGTDHSGLGLSQVYGYAKQSGGYARIDSEPGQGTTVQMFLPRFGDTDPVARQTMAATADRGRGETVLVVEDASLVRVALARMLADLGYNPVTASNAEEALVLLESKARIDLLLTDMMLPGGPNGAELAVAARRLRVDIGILHMSGCAGGLPAEAGDDETTFLAKPFSKAQLASRLRAILESKAIAA